MPEGTENSVALLNPFDEAELQAMLKKASD